MRYFLCFFLLANLVVGCKTATVIANNLAEREANEIVVLLQSRGIDAMKVPAPVSTTGGGGGAQLWNISVPARQITDALAILNQAGLPRVKGTSLLDLFGAKGLVPSEMENKIRYQEGLSEQLAMTIRKMDGVIDANVQITMNQEDEEQNVVTASVYVKHRGILDNPNSLLVTKIKRLISAAVPGLTVDNVSVVSDRALISDISLESLQVEEGQDLVSVWGIIVSRASTGLLRTILYVFIVVLFIFACLVVWMVWKAYPLIQKHGYKTLFTLKPYEAILSSESSTLSNVGQPSKGGLEEETIEMKSEGEEEE